MERLSLETFVNAQRDSEIAQYAVLSGLQEYQREFSRSRLYPSLSDLIRLHQELSDFLQNRDQMQRRFPQELKRVDEKGPQLVFEPVDQENPRLEALAEVIRWALPLIQSTINEGAEIYNFVDEHITIAGVGLMPVYCDEGYWFVPENRRSLLHLMRYEISLYSSPAGRHRTLKTRLLESIEQREIAHSPESLKLSLLERYHELPNPATFQCATDLEFPYAETMLPVAKRKLMAHLFS